MALPLPFLVCKYEGMTDLPPLEWTNPRTDERWNVDGTLVRVNDDPVVDLTAVHGVNDHISYGKASTGYNLWLWTDDDRKVKLTYSQPNRKGRPGEVGQFRRQILLRYGAARPNGLIHPGGDLGTRVVNAFLGCVFLAGAALIDWRTDQRAWGFLPFLIGSGWYFYNSFRQPMKAIDFAVALTAKEKRQQVHDPVTALLALIFVAVAGFVLLRLLIE